MTKKRVKLGFAPTRRPVHRFNLDVAIKDKERIEAKLKEWNVEYVGLDWLNEDGFLYDPIDAPRVAAHFRAEGVEALFVPHINFGTESAVGVLARELGKPVLLWGPRDPAPPPNKGERSQDIQCGLFATSKALRRMKVPFTYIVNSATDSAVFKRGFHLFLGAASAANGFLGARIGQVSTRPPGFLTTMCNESELLERWGVQIVPTTLENVRQAQTQKIEENSDEFQETISAFKATANFSWVGEEHIARLAGLKLALLDFCQQHKLDSVAVHCHQPFRDALGVAACFVNSVITDMGIPIACETDINGALTTLLVQGAALNTTPTFFADLTIRHPENSNAELLWHCGNFAPSLALEPDARELRLHRGSPVAASWEIKGGEITVARFDGDNGDYSLFIGEAKGTVGPSTNGAYVWVEVDDWPKWEEKLIYGPYIHHCVGVHAQVAPVLYEACKYIPGLEPDPIDPTEQEIRAFWRGADLEAEATETTEVQAALT
jgi:L-fucose isomerase-like protein